MALKKFSVEGKIVDRFQVEVEAGEHSITIDQQGCGRQRRRPLPGGVCWPASLPAF